MDPDAPTAPPGTPAPIVGSGELEPIAGLSKVLIGLVWAVAAVPLAWGVAAMAGFFELPRGGLRFNVGEAVDPRVAGWIVALAVLALVQFVVALVWMHRARSNAAAAMPGGKWGPGAAVAVWFVPYGYLVLGYFVMRDIWHGTHGRDGWERPRAPGWVLAGWLLWTLPQAIGHAIGFGQGRILQFGKPPTMLGMGHGTSPTLFVVAAAIELVAAAFFVRFVARVAATQTALVPVGHRPVPTPEPA